MVTAFRLLSCLPLSLLLACGTGERDPVADAKFANEQRIGREDVTQRQEQDAEFMVEAATGSRFGAALGQLASSRAASPGLRTFGPQLSRDAAALSAALSTLARQKSLTLPEGLGRQQQAALDKLGSLSGTAFDQALLEEAGDYFAEAHDTFDDMAEEAYDGDIRAVAAKYAPTLKAHYDHTDELREQLKP